MRIPGLVIILVAMAAPLAAQQPAQADQASVPASAVAPAQPKMSLHEAAMQFVEAADARPKLDQNMDKLIGDGKEALLKRNPLINPKFVEEWGKRMRLRVNLDEFVDAIARVYEKYFTVEDLETLAKAQLARKHGKVYSLSPELAQKLKSHSAEIQSDINAETSMIGSRLGIQVGEEIAKDHPDWVKPNKSNAAPAPKS